MLKTAIEALRAVQLASAAVEVTYRPLGGGALARDAEHKSHTADARHAGGAVEDTAQHLPLFPHSGEQFAVDPVYDAYSACAAYRVSAECRAVVAGREYAGALLSEERRSDRKASAEALGSRDYIRLYAEIHI